MCKDPQPPRSKNHARQRIAILMHPCHRGRQGTLCWLALIIDYNTATLGTKPSAGTVSVGDKREANLQLMRFPVVVGA